MCVDVKKFNRRRLTQSASFMMLLTDQQVGVRDAWGSWLPSVCLSRQTAQSRANNQWDHLASDTRYRSEMGDFGWDSQGQPVSCSCQTQTIDYVRQQTWVGQINKTQADVMTTQILNDVGHTLYTLIWHEQIILQPSSQMHFKNSTGILGQIFSNMY